MRRLIQFGLIGLVVAAMSGPATPSSALEQAPGLTVAENQTVAQEYQPIPIFNPAPDNDATGSNMSPDVCKTAAWCDVVPLEVVVPAGLGSEDEFFVRVKLEWETNKVPGNPLMQGTRTVNDLDLSVWDDPQGEMELAMGASELEPEELTLFRPTKGRYQLVVTNYLGPNTGYRLTATYKAEPIIPPFESLEPIFELPPLPAEAPAFEPPAEEAEPEEAEAPPDFSGFPLETPTTPAVDPTPAMPLEPVAVGADPDFEDFDDSEFTDALAAPVGNDVLQERKARSVGPPEPASAPMVVLWMAVLPLALFGGAGFWLARRGSGVLRVK